MKGDVERWKPMFEKLYDEHESVKVRFLGFMTHDNRYDFGFIYTNMFLKATYCLHANRKVYFTWTR